MPFLTIKKRVQKVIHNIERAFFNLRFQIKIAPKNYCYISQNCIGGKFYQIEKRPYSSPTIGLWLESSDFLEFCENLAEYFSLTLEQDLAKSAQMKYPVGRLGDIKIYFLHYSSFQVAKKDWERRLARIDLDRVFLVMTDRDGFSDDNLIRFQKLRTNKKILFSHRLYSDMKNILYVPGYEHESSVGDLVGDFSKLMNVRVRLKLFNLLGC